LRARTDTNLRKISDQACGEMLIANADDTAVFEYWHVNTFDYLDFSASIMFDWVDVNMGASDGQKRNLSAKAAYDATAATGVDLAGYDGFIVLMLPGTGLIPNPEAGQPGQPDFLTYTFDGGTGELPDQRPAAVFPVMSSDHMFMCHATGHVPGYHHTYGLMNNGTDWNQTDKNYIESPESREPYDIMSSASFGSRWENPAETHYFGSPTYFGPKVAGWPFFNAFKMGPAPARAQVHLWDGAAVPKASLIEIPTPKGSSKKFVRLYRATSYLWFPTLLIVKPSTEGASGQGRIYVEYRDAQGWDVGVKISGSDLSRRAVVVHALADTPSDGTRCWYRGRILVPLETDGDLIVPDQKLVIRVIDVSPSLEYVDLELVETSGHEVHIDQSIHDIEVNVVNETVRHTPCGDLHSGTYSLDRNSVFTPVTYGYGGYGAPDRPSLKLTWQVGSVTVAPGNHVINPISTDGKSVTIHTTLDSTTDVLVLVSSASDGAYSVEVRCTASELDGSNAQDAADDFEPIGQYTGLRRTDAVALRACLSKLLAVVRLRPRDLLIPPGPDPFRENENNLINLERLEKAAKLVDIVSAKTGVELRSMVKLLYGSLRGGGNVGRD